MQSLAHQAHRPNGDTRELRALELYRTRGHEIHQTAEELYLVPSCTGRGFYSVDYHEETCDCPDFTHRHENCKHILAVGIYAAKRRLRVSPAGDPFVAAAKSEARPCLCYDGYHYMGHEVELPDGDLEVEYERVPCRRCKA